jgi:RHH-type rel operon transcriptional repressor/antitoxin RelB
MAQISTRLPDQMVQDVDNAAKVLHRTRAEIIRQALEMYLEDFDDLNTAIDRLRDPADRSMDWDEAKRALLAAD